MKADRDSVTRKIRIAKGQLEGILRMIDEDRYCIDIATQLMAASSLLRKTTQEVLEAHIMGCVRESLSSDDAETKVEEALAVLEKLAEL